MGSGEQVPVEDARVLMEVAGEIHQYSGPLHLPFLGPRSLSPLRLAHRPSRASDLRLPVASPERSHVLQPWPSGMPSPFQPSPAAMILK